MSCISVDGKTNYIRNGQTKSLKNGAFTPEEVASKTGQPLFKVRSDLRELKCRLCRRSNRQIRTFKKQGKRNPINGLSYLSFLV